ncbi:autophagy protein 5, putative [Plasmodium sp. gorilla clade G1]|nr:autophagy protein 5, putative [Plasmodium sp. gorilla clade G1]
MEIGYMEVPNIKDINSNIEKSGLVLCVSLNQKESESLISPSYYYIYVHRYMYLSNIIPKCLEFFKSFILPFYGNKFGVYFECIKKEQNKSSNNNNNNNNNNITYTSTNNYEEKIVLDWRLPIGVLFDIYCDLDKSQKEYIKTYEKFNDTNINMNNKKNITICSNNELFLNHINIVKLKGTDKNYDKKSNERQNQKNIYDVNRNISTNTNNSSNVNHQQNCDRTDDDTLHKGDDILHKGDDILHKGDDILYKDNDILHKGDDILHKGNDILHKGDDILHKGDDILHTDAFINEKETKEGTDKKKQINRNIKNEERERGKEVKNIIVENYYEENYMKEKKIIVENGKGSTKNDVEENKKDINTHYDDIKLNNVDIYDDIKLNNFDIYDDTADFQYIQFIQNEKINNEWYNKQFVNISNKNIPWMLIVHFKGEEEYPLSIINKKYDEKNTHFKGDINILPYNNYIPLYKGFNNFEEYIINQLKKANYILNKNNRALEILPQRIQKDILYSLKHFHIEKICSLYREYIDYNMINFINYFNNSYIKKVQQVCDLNRHKDNSIQINGKSSGKQNEENLCLLKMDLHEEESPVKITHCEDILNSDNENNNEHNCHRNSYDVHLNENFINDQSQKNHISNIRTSYNNDHVSDSLQTDIQNDFSSIILEKTKEQGDHINFKNNLHNNEKYPNVYDILKDEKVLKDCPIILHIYGPPYNQILTKYPFLKLIHSNKNNNNNDNNNNDNHNNSNKYDGCKKYIQNVHLNTLGDFLHEQLPSFVRKIINKDEKNETSHILNKYDKDKYLNSETIYYFIEDDYLIFSPYMFIIVNGIQIPLNTPLYWLAANFSQFDHFLHITIRIPPY